MGPRRGLFKGAFGRVVELRYRKVQIQSGNQPLL